jgi:hypothetical protein
MKVELTEQEREAMLSEFLLDAAKDLVIMPLPDDVAKELNWQQKQFAALCRRSAKSKIMIDRGPMN